MIRPIFIFKAALVLVLLYSPVNFAEDPRQDLENIHRRIEEKRREISGILKKESSILKNLRQVDQGLAQARSQTAQLKQQEKELKTLKAQKQKRIAELEGAGQVTRQSLARGLRLLYRQGQAGYLGYLVEAQSFAELIARGSLLRYVVRANRSALQGVRQNIQQLQTEQQQAEQNLARLATVSQELKNSRDQYRLERQRKKILLNLVHEQKDFYLRSIQEMEAASANLQQLVQNLDKPGTKVAANFNFLAQIGNLPAPVTKAKLGRTFGERWDPRLRGMVRFKGLEFLVAEETQVFAVAAGQVVFAGWFEGYGQMIIIDHGQGYFSLYGNFSQLSKKINDTVKAGEQLGLSGSTGSLTGPRLYFEIRHRGLAKDPRQWLKLP